MLLLILILLPLPAMAGANAMSMPSVSAMISHADIAREVEVKRAGRRLMMSISGCAIKTMAAAARAVYHFSENAQALARAM